jgi:hypothetical protein
MPGFLIQQPQTDTNPHRWCPINALKNSPVTIVLHCSWSGERYPLPATANAAFNDDDANYFDEASPTSADLIGSTSLYDVIKMVKAQIPTLYMWEEGTCQDSLSLKSAYSPHCNCKRLAKEILEMYRRY